MGLEMDGFRSHEGHDLEMKVVGTRVKGLKDGAQMCFDFGFEIRQA